MKADQLIERCAALFTLLLLVLPLPGHAFESGSTGSDGAFNPTADIELALPPSGIFNFTEVNIPDGVTVTFAKNADNTPVRILVSGNASINGVITVAGGEGGSGGEGSRGQGGPGGFDGGLGALPSSSGFFQGGDGQGPGRGLGSPAFRFSSTNIGDGADGSYATRGGSGSGDAVSGPVYGNEQILPLIGGSGGGSAAGGNTVSAGGGGGGGAVLIAVSGTLTIGSTAIINANGGNPGVLSSQSEAGDSGAGSGGAIRLIATTMQGAGTLTAAGGTGINAQGGNGRIRLEAENFSWAGGSTPAFRFSTPGPVLVSNIPVLRIVSVNGVPVPASPTGFRDVELPGLTTNPVAIELETSIVPLGTIIEVRATPERGRETVVNSTPVAGSVNAGTASVNIDLPNGNSTLFAQTTFTVTAALGQDFSKYAQGEQVERVKVALNEKGQSVTTFITASGKEYTWPSNVVAMN